MDFSTVGQELGYWLSHITQSFGKNGETGIDVGLPYHTPVYATTGGKVVGAGFYGGGGVASIQIAPTTSEYYQHLSDLVVSKGQTVKAGQLIGYSGGQIGYGDHPSSTKFSNGPHLEVGFNAPYGAANQSIWSPLGPNFNPINALKSIGSAGGFPTFGIPGTAGGGTQPAQTAVQNAAGGFFSDLLKNFGGVTAQDFAWRSGLIVGGFILIVVGVLVFFSHEAEQSVEVVKGAAKVAAAS